MKQQVRVLEVTNQDLKIEMSERVTFEQLKLMMTSMQGGQELSQEERARMFDSLKREKIGEPKIASTRRSQSQVNLPDGKINAKPGSIMETESFQGYELDEKSQNIEPSFKHEAEDDGSGLEKSLIIKSP